MSEHDLPEGSTFCQIIGCTGHSITSRWVVVGNGEKREVGVCWKHTEGDLDPATIEAAS